MLMYRLCAAILHSQQQRFTSLQELLVDPGHIGLNKADSLSLSAGIFNTVYALEQNTGAGAAGQRTAGIEFT